MTEKLATIFQLGQREVIAVVGAGGKTTLIHRLYDELVADGRSVVITTTTHLGVGQELGRNVVVKGRKGDKLVGLTPAEVGDLSKQFDYVLVEADGARHRLVKAPDSHEPAIPTSATLVLCLMAAEAVDRVIEDVAHRPLRVAALAGCSPYDRLTPARAAQVLQSTDGGRKGLPTQARHHIVLITRQLDDEPKARAVALELTRFGVTAVQVDLGRGVHQAADVGYNRAADTYVAGRPDYPAQLDDWLCGETGLGLGPDRQVVDVAAGTGKFTRSLIATGAHVTAVEPVAALRSAFVAHYPTVAALDGVAEQLPLGPASVDVATVAQAFHWFDAPRAVTELARVIRSGGTVGLVWNRRRTDDPLQAAFEAVVAEYRGTTPSHHTSRWRDAFGHDQRFDQVIDGHLNFDPLFTVDMLVARALSTSFIAALGDEQQALVASAIRALPTRMGLGEVFEFRHVTEFHTIRRR